VLKSTLENRLQTYEWFVYVFFSIKLPPTSKGDVDKGKAIEINIGKGQDHNTKKSFSISRVQFDRRIEFGTLGDMEVFFTYVTHPCDNQESNTQLVGYTIIYVRAIMLDSQQQRKIRMTTKTKSTSSFGGE